MILKQSCPLATAFAGCVKQMPEQEVALQTLISSSRWLLTEPNSLFYLLILPELIGTSQK